MNDSDRQDTQGQTAADRGQTRWSTASFAGFELDRDAGRLHHGTQTVHLRPRTWDVLVRLVEATGALVPVSELQRAAWRDAHVSTKTIANAITDLRTALGDTDSGDRLIESVSRRGYRLSAPVSFDAHSRATLTSLIGRKRQLVQVRDFVQSCLQGRSGLLVVHGAPGIGKSALLEAIRDMRFDETPGPRMLRSQCRRGSVEEPFAPLLEALGRAADEYGQREIQSVLQSLAPAWLLQLPSLHVDDDQARTVRGHLRGAGPARMTREGATLLARLGQPSGLVLLIDDVEACDAPSLMVLDTLLETQPAARVAVISTMRDGEFLDEEAARIFRDLSRRAEELSLPPWSAEEIHRYVRTRTDTAVADSCTERLLEASAGSPLFVRSLLDDLLDCGAIRSESGAWRVDRTRLTSELALTPDLHAIMAETLHRLPEHTVRLLEIAACMGPVFTGGCVAAAAGAEESVSERTLHDLARRGHIVTLHRGLRESGDSAVYEFVHETFRLLLQDRLAPSERRKVCQDLARATAALDHELLSPQELAQLWERGGDHLRAGLLRARAASDAGQRLAYREANRQVERALRLIPRNGDPITRRISGSLELNRANLLVVTRGGAPPETIEAYERAIELLSSSDRDGIDVFRARMGLLLARIARAEYRAAIDLGDQLLHSARTHLPTLRTAACTYQAIGRIFLGDVESAHRQIVEGLEFAADPSVPVLCDIHTMARMLAAWSGALLGRIGEARQLVGATHASCDESTNSYERLYAASQEVAVVCALREPERVVDLAETVLWIGRNEGLGNFVTSAVVSREWALARLGRERSNVRRMQQAIRRESESAELCYTAGHHMMVAEVQLIRSDTEGAATSLRRARALLKSTGERLGEPELLRLEAWREATVAAGSSAKLRSTLEASAADRLRRSMEQASSMGMRLANLRAAMDLAELLRRIGDRARAGRTIGEALATLAHETSPEITTASRMLEVLRAA
jgi:DNA-binding winged helix-turn-helix (wHTH) protein/tetratricopeptide (TPR) repeat protein